MRLAALHASIAQGPVDGGSGRTKQIDEVFNRLEVQYRAMAAPGE